MKKVIKGGLFIVVEGGEGAGKTTLAKKLVDYFNNNEYTAIYTREPGGIEVCEKIRNILMTEDLDGVTQLMLFAASRHLLTQNLINPNLEKGNIVICDRYSHSSYANQGGGCGIPEYQIKYIQDIVARKPDIEIILLVDPEIGLHRVFDNDREHTIIDAKGVEYHTKVNNVYKEIMIADNGTKIDANQDQQQVYKEAIEDLATIMKNMNINSRTIVEE